MTLVETSSMGEEDRVVLAKAARILNVAMNEKGLSNREWKRRHTAVRVCRELARGGTS